MASTEPHNHAGGVRGAFPRRRAGAVSLAGGRGVPRAPLWAVSGTVALVSLVATRSKAALFGDTPSNLTVSTPFWVRLGTPLGTRHLETAGVAAHRTSPHTTHGT
ncbi:hypothetical protein ACQPYK_05215 [Streptosporangium sp. CA-135522]|uniref:hypothetical protein n=1 Tax=Streptosporangium sp. CA-135522 TaxID=3240072 RepID=UPI003D8F2804